MTQSVHTIIHQTLLVDVPTEEHATHLMGRLAALEQTALPAILEREFNRVDTPGQIRHIPKLVIELGVLPVSGFEGALLTRFEAALARALDDLSLEPSKSQDLSRLDSQLELLEYYLRRGTLPSWASHLAPISTDRSVAELLDSGPTQLLGMLRESASVAGVIERLVRQVSDPTLRRLLTHLSPEHAALVLLYMTDLRALHRAASLVALADPAFAQLLWVIVLRFFLQDPGSQFNRKNFVRSLLLQVSTSEAVPYTDLVRALERGLVAVEKSRPLASSLPGVIRELVSEDRETSTETKAPPASDGGFSEMEVGASLLALFEAFLEGMFPARFAPVGGELSRVIGRLADQSPAGLAAAVRRKGHHRQALDRLVHSASERALGKVLTVLDPASADVVINYLFDIQSLHRASALVTMNDGELSHLMWLIALRFLAGDPGTHFNRKSFVRSLLTGISSAESVPYAALLRALEKGLRASAGAGPLRSSLPAVIQELANELMMGDAAPKSTQRVTAEEDALAFLLEGKAAFLNDAALADVLQKLLSAPSADLVERIAAALSDAEVVERWVHTLPEFLLETICAVRAPQNHRQLIDTANTVTQAFSAAALEVGSVPISQPEMWRVLLGMLALTTEPELSTKEVVLRYLTHLGRRTKEGTTGVDRQAAIGSRFLDQLEKRAAAGGNRQLMAALNDNRPDFARTWSRSVSAEIRPLRRAPAAGQVPPAAKTSVRGKTAFSLEGTSDEVLSDPVFVSGAGVVLLAAFLPRMVESLGWLVKDDQQKPRFRDAATVGRACHLIHWLALEKTITHEHQLALPKVLCGVPLSTVVDLEFMPTEEERSEVFKVLRSALRAAPVFSGTSVEGLRHTFLQRDGKLVQKSEKWLLTVQRKTVDILLDQVPWSYSVVVCPWMKAPLHVLW
ncbi:MAG: hypothetical protein IPK82_00770 [Polyangiaceae bacterium]|nr:hypothetical protein [Polyangiaceae bacterium]